MTSGLLTSNTDKWETPMDLFERLNQIFCFELDACADETNHKCDMYFTEEQDGLKKSWGGVQNMVQSPVRQGASQVDQEGCRNSRG